MAWHIPVRMHCCSALRSTSGLPVMRMKVMQLLTIPAVCCEMLWCAFDVRVRYRSSIIFWGTGTVLVRAGRGAGAAFHHGRIHRPARLAGQPLRRRHVHAQRTKRGATRRRRPADESI
jgi:hypothetical protein